MCAQIVLIHCKDNRIIPHPRPVAIGVSKHIRNLIALFGDIGNEIARCSCTIQRLPIRQDKSTVSLPLSKSLLPQTFQNLLGRQLNKVHTNIVLFFIFLGEHHRNLGRKGCIRRDLLHGVASRTAWCRGTCGNNAHKKCGQYNE